MAESTEPKSSAYGKRPLWQWLLIYAVVAVIVYGLIYYFVLGKKNTYNKSNVQYSPTVSQDTPTPAPVSQASPSASMSENKVTVEGNEFKFTPSTLTFKKGQPVQLTFKNTGKFPHNLVISDLNVSTKTIKPGEEDTITYTPEKAGTFTFICSVPGHADKGMTGTLTVE